MTKKDDKPVNKKEETSTQIAHRRLLEFAKQRNTRNSKFFGVPPSINFYLKKDTRVLSFCENKKVILDFAIRLYHDGFRNFTSFFRGMISLYLEHDLDFLKCVEKIRYRDKSIKWTGHGKDVRKKYKNLIKRGKQMMEDLGLSESQKKEIFDKFELDEENFDL